MPKTKELTGFQKGQIFALFEENVSKREIARRLGIAESSVRYNLKKKAETGSMKNAHRSGRPKVMTAAEERNLVVRCKRSPFKPATHLRQDVLSATGKTAGISTVRKVLADNDLSAYRPRSVPLLQPRHIAARKDFGKTYETWAEEDWRRVLWSDESRFCFFRSDGKGYVRRPLNKSLDPRYTRPTVKHAGGGIMVWGCFSRAGVGNLVLIEGTMNQKKYLDVLKDHMIPSAHQLIGNNFVFQQDNALCHTAKSITSWFADPTPDELKETDDWSFDVLKWPAQSPDLNPIENLWNAIEEDLKVRGVQPKSKDDLFREVKFSWESLSKAYLMKLSDSMINRCRDVVNAKGFHIDY